MVTTYTIICFGLRKCLQFIFAPQSRCGSSIATIVLNIWILITLFLTIYTWIDRKSKLHVLYCCNYFTKYKNSVLYILKYLELILFSVQ